MSNTAFSVELSDILLFRACFYNCFYFRFAPVVELVLVDASIFVFSDIWLVLEEVDEYYEIVGVTTSLGSQSND